MYFPKLAVENLGLKRASDQASDFKDMENIIYNADALFRYLKHWQEVFRFFALTVECLLY